MFIARETSENEAPAERDVLLMNNRRYISLLTERRCFFAVGTYKHAAPPEPRQLSHRTSLSHFNHPPQFHIRRRSSDHDFDLAGLNHKPMLINIPISQLVCT
jgi:hypothetical protein